MQYTNDFLAAVKYLQSYVYPELHPAMVAQWILESDRGNSKLARDANNYAGMKWRKELAGIGKPLLIDVPSEPCPVEFTAFASPRYCKPLLIDVPSEPCPVEFTAFASPRYFVRGFWKFLDREPYRGWRNTVSPEQYIEHIGSTWAADPRYIAKVKALIPEARKLLQEDKTMPDPQWFELLRKTDSGAHLIAYSGSEALFRTPIRTTEDLAVIFDLYGKHNVEIAPEGKLMPVTEQKTIDDLQQVPEPEKPSAELAGLKVFLEAGHGWSGSSFDPGAVGHVQEHTQNKIQATACAQWLRARGAEVRLELYDRGTPARDLRTRGRIAGGSDVFVSFHHNAFNSKAQGTETLVDRLADTDDKALAEIIQSHMSKASPFQNRGVKQQGLGVLRGAKPGSFAACLTEAYFVDGPGIQNPDGLDKKLGVAVAQGIAEFAKAAGKV